MPKVVIIINPARFICQRYSYIAYFVLFLANLVLRLYAEKASGYMLYKYFTLDYTLD